MTAVTVHHQIDGDAGLAADAPTIVFSGSLGSTLAMWDPQVAALSQAFRLVRYDTRGHGRSPLIGTDCSIDDLADDLLALLDRLELGRAHLVGLSLGGMTSMRLAARNPERIETLTLLCTSALLGPAQNWLDRAATVRSDGTGAVADTVVTRWFSPGFLTAEPNQVAYYRDMIAATPPAGYAACCEAVAAMDLRAELPAISAPTLVIAGLQDPATPPAHLAAIAKAIPRSRLQILDPAAHLANVERADVVNAALLEHVGTAGVRSPLTGRRA